MIAFLAAAAATPAPQPVRVVKAAPVTVATAGKPTPIDVRSWFKADDYPAEAQRAGKEGTVVFEVEVGADGHPTACHIEKSSGTPSLDDATCKIVMEKAHFMPAMVNGKPVASSFTQPTTWRLQGGAPTNGYFAVILDYAKDGGQPACSVVQKGVIDGPTCDQVLSHYGSYGKTEGLTKFVELLSVTLRDAEPYRGETDWGRRYAFTSVDLYLTEDGKSSCVVVA
ncbi:MAG: energy transducer TonB [Sphingomicrobium sp.]